ncbi:MAG: hypothetical protein BGO98_03650 [Myxococcales bacterium 68-20]|nr:MAG: hypothetical protein BGO98_03650 [Myxococcales bacterium 68-20]
MGGEKPVFLRAPPIDRVDDETRSPSTGRSARARSRASATPTAKHVDACGLRSGLVGSSSLASGSRVRHGLVDTKRTWKLIGPFHQR